MPASRVAPVSVVPPSFVAVAAPVPVLAVRARVVAVPCGLASPAPPSGACSSACCPAPRS
eukprot:7388889-Prymnesium_polylepis.1